MEDNQVIKTVENSGKIPAFGTVSFKDFSELMNFANKIAESKLTPLKKGEDVLAAILYGKELGLEPMTSVNNIYPINGKATLGVHLINALLQKAGIVVEVLNDYEPCVGFALNGDDGKVIFKDAQGTVVETDEKGKPTVAGAKPIIVRVDYISSEPKSYETRSKTIVDYRTTMRFTRQLKQPDKSYKEVVIIYSFGNSDAIKAGLLGGDKPKDNWTNWTKQMCSARCLTFGGRMIGADILMGMMEFTEMADISGIKYTMTEEGAATVIIAEEKEEKTSTEDSSSQTTKIEDAVVENEVK